MDKSHVLDILDEEEFVGDLPHKGVLGIGFFVDA
jgi:hypothetical protein